MQTCGGRLGTRRTYLYLNLCLCPVLEQVALGSRAPEPVVGLDDVGKARVTLHQYPDGVDWGEEKAYLVFGIAGAGGEHLQVLANVARALEDEEVVEKMRTTTDVDWLLQILS